ncbi:MAG: hypothetical protein NT120_02995 [Candidatus Aenigmarchaeota archaeon]|nr:hypothetical protein [Candidatus Aenigmarchaeota archaeon]
MPYEVGVSSGFWQIAKDPALLGMSQKAGFIATAGVTFNQIDMETVAEFLEPRVKENVKRIQKELGLKIGMHAEIGSMSALESGERRIWDEAHKRLVLAVKNATEMNIVYINFHTSSTGLLQFNEARIRPFGFQYQVVAPNGRPFYEFADKSEGAIEYIKQIITGGHMRDMIAREPHFREKLKALAKRYDDLLKKRIDEAIRKLESSPDYKSLPPEQRRQVKENASMQVSRDVNQEFEQEERKLAGNADELYDSWKHSDFGQYVMEAGEIDAYMTVASDMHKNGDMLWTNIVGSKSAGKAYIEEEHAFNAAVASAYIIGHLTVKNNKYNRDILDGMSVLEFVSKKGLILCFELPEVERREDQGEGLYRLFHPKHTQWFVRKLNSPFVRLCIDFEHMLAQNLDPSKVLPELPNDFGKLVYLFHLGEPKPYWGMAHIPIPLGSHAQEIIYEWLYIMRQKGFKNGVLIFERGGGRAGGRTTFEVFELSVLALKNMAKYLEQNIKPDELPLDFYGISEKNEAVYARELVTVKEHAWDPLEGVLSIPEEKHTFLSGAAIAKNKGQEWEKRKFR